MDKKKILPAIWIKNIPYCPTCNSKSLHVIDMKNGKCKDCQQLITF